MEPWDRHRRHNLVAHWIPKLKYIPRTYMDPLGRNFVPNLRLFRAWNLWETVKLRATYPKERGSRPGYTAFMIAPVLFIGKASAQDKKWSASCLANAQARAATDISRGSY